MQRPAAAALAAPAGEIWDLWVAVVVVVSVGSALPAHPLSLPGTLSARDRDGADELQHRDPFRRDYALGRVGADFFGAGSAPS